MDKYVLVDRSGLQEMLYKLVRSSNQKDRLRIISSAEAMERLNLKKSAFYDLAKSPESLLKRSKAGGYLESSVQAEILRLTSEK